MFEQVGRVGSPSAAMRRLIERGSAAIAALDAHMDAAFDGLVDVDQRLRAAEALAEPAWRAGQGHAVALGADL